MKKEDYDRTRLVFYCADGVDTKLSRCSIVKEVSNNKFQVSKKV